MAGRPKKVSDTSGYKQLPTVTWKESIREKGYDPGIISRSPTREMMRQGGAKIRQVDNKSETYYDIVYDLDYVLEYFHRRLILNLSFLIGDTFDNESYEKFFADLRTYSIATYEKETQASLEIEAEDMAAKYPGQSKEQWLEILTKQSVGRTIKIHNKSSSGTSQKGDTKKETST